MRASTPSSLLPRYFCTHLNPQNLCEYPSTRGALSKTSIIVLPVLSGARPTLKAASQIPWYHAMHTQQCMPARMTSPQTKHASSDTPHPTSHIPHDQYRYLGR